LANTPIFSTALTSIFADSAIFASETYGPPSKMAKQNSLKPSLTRGLSSSIIP
jgi:hypothetical protein